MYVQNTVKSTLESKTIYFNNSQEKQTNDIQKGLR